MIGVSTRTKKDVASLVGTVRSYSEVVAFLDACVPYEYSEQAVSRVVQLDAAFEYVSKKIDTILVGGVNGKSTSISFAAMLFREEGVKAAAIYSSHFLNYNERLVVGGEVINNKQFTDIVGEVIAVAQSKNISATALEIMFIAGLLYAQATACDVALVEVALGGEFDPSRICSAKLTVVTRVADDVTATLGADLDDVAERLVSIVQPKTWFISAEQSKIRLQKMKAWVEARGGKWAMPIRKLAPLPYIYEQLYGRIASLGERIVQIYVEQVQQRFSPFLRGNLLATQRGQRGRPTLEAKRQAELNPIKTMKVFWSEQFELLHGRFEILNKEKPTILIDNATNLDAFANVFLGVRLLHYQRPLKGFVITLGAKKTINRAELVKAIRYLLKKVPGEVFFVPLPDATSHDPNALLAVAKDFNVRARAFTSIEQAFATAKDVVDKREGLVAVTGSTGMVRSYWQIRGVKKI